MKSPKRLLNMATAFPLMWPYLGGTLISEGYSKWAPGSIGDLWILGWHPFEWWTVSLYLSDARSIPLGWSSITIFAVKKHAAIVGKFTPIGRLIVKIVPSCGTASKTGLAFHVVTFLGMDDTRCIPTSTVIVLLSVPVRRVSNCSLQLSDLLKQRPVGKSLGWLGRVTIPKWLSPG